MNIRFGLAVLSDYRSLSVGEFQQRGSTEVQQRTAVIHHQSRSVPERGGIEKIMAELEHQREGFQLRNQFFIRHESIPPSCRP